MWVALSFVVGQSVDTAETVTWTEDEDSSLSVSWLCRQYSQRPPRHAALFSHDGLHPIKPRAKRSPSSLSLLLFSTRNEKWLVVGLWWKDYSQRFESCITKQFAHMLANNQQLSMRRKGAFCDCLRFFCCVLFFVIILVFLFVTRFSSSSS